MKKEKSLYTLVFIALLTISAYFLADTVDALIGRSLNANAAQGAVLPLDRDRTAMQPRRDLSAYSSILERGLFGDGKAPSTGIGAGEVPTVNYKLIGTVEGEAFAGAVLEDKSGQAFYRINQKLPDGSDLIKIMRDKVIIRRSDGATVNLEVVDDTKIVAVQQPGMNGGAGVKKLSDGKFMVDQKEVLASTENMGQILTQARALPYVEQGKTVGFRISEIIPGSIYEKIGLQNGDIIQRVNSQDVDDPAKFFQLYQGLKNERSIAIDLLRNGQRQTLNYDIQ
ncbi:MAG TPA: type II secretion system protein GspC [Nitrospirota bacterium]|nr:type II secretion system protein GspC [Nitrospirota bacterium]